MEKFSQLTSYLQAVSDAASLRDMALRLLFADISEDYLVGIAGFRLRLPADLVLEFTAGAAQEAQLGTEDLWGDSPLALSIRTGKPLEEMKLDRRVTYIPLLRRDVPLGAVVLIGSSKSQVPEEFAWIQASISAAGGRILAGEVSKGSGSKVISLGPDGTLTSRQKEVLEMMSLGFTNDQIGRKLHVSSSTVRHESMKIFRTLGVANRIEAAARGEELGILTNATGEITRVDKS